MRLNPIPLWSAGSARGMGWHLWWTAVLLLALFNDVRADVTQPPAAQLQPEQSTVTQAEPAQPQPEQPAAAPTQRPAAQVQPEQAPTAATSPALPAATPAKVAPDYVIGPGDVLQVFVWRNPELTTTVPVRPDGKISTPLVEDMVASGKTPSQLARDIERVLGEYIRSPQVNVIVSTPASTLSQVKVIGQVKAPQGVPFREGMRVLDLVLAAGGLGDFAAGNRAKLVRLQGDKEIEIKVRLADLIGKGDMSQNMLLKAGDVLVVPQSMF